MTPHALDIPETEAELADWLERILVRPDLGELVAQLQVFQSPRLEALALSELPLSELFARGLGVLPDASLRRLLASPATLLELQEAVLLNGGPYWNDQLAQATDHAWVATSWQRLEAKLVPATDAFRSSVVAKPVDRVSSRRRWLGYLATAAASLTFGWFSHDRFSSPITGSAWGWNRPGIVGTSLSRETYLESLSQAAGDWFQVRPRDPVALAQRITEFRAGCSRLLISDHPALRPDDRQWLREKCQKWATRLDELLTTLEKDQDVATVLAESDATIRKLQAALTEHAHHHRES